MSTAASPVATVRCHRCGTKIRNRRTICPSCGYDLAAVPSQSSQNLASEPNGAEAPNATTTSTPHRVSAKAGVKLCTLCMVSVPEDKLEDSNGQKVCPDCAQNIKTKALKKSANPPPK